MANPEIDLQRHLNRRLVILHRHEKQRVLGDAAKDSNFEKVRQVNPEAAVDQLPQFARETSKKQFTGLMFGLVNETEEEQMK